MLPPPTEHFLLPHKSSSYFPAFMIVVVLRVLFGFCLFVCDLLSLISYLHDCEQHLLEHRQVANGLHQTTEENNSLNQ